jgi:hypothetical protein
MKLNDWKHIPYVDDTLIGHVAFDKIVPRLLFSTIDPPRGTTGIQPRPLVLSMHSSLRWSMVYLLRGLVRVSSL